MIRDTKPWQIDIFVHAESNHIPEGQFALLVKGNEPSVYAFGTRASWQPCNQRHSNGGSTKNKRLFRSRAEVKDSF